MPLHNNAMFGQDDVMSTAFQIDKLANDGSVHGGDAIVVVHYGAHLQAFPPNVFRNRLRILARALQSLQAKKPSTKIFVRGAAPVIDDIYWLDVKVALLFDEILHQEFAYLQDRVIYLDVFSIMVANNIELLGNGVLVLRSNAKLHNTEQSRIGLPTYPLTHRTYPSTYPAHRTHASTQLTH